LRTSSVRASAAEPRARVRGWLQAARRAWALRGCALLSCILGSAGELGCAATPAASDPSAELASDLSPFARAAPLDFSFAGADDLVVSSATTRGRVTALAFVATYDMASQLLLRRLAEVIVRFTPRANAAAVVVEAPRYAELLPVYRDSMQLPFPVVMVDFATAQGQGPFAWLEHVPTLVVLDRSGREVARRSGSLAISELEGDLTRASRTPR
jgi:hypothetical protein